MISLIKRIIRKSSALVFLYERVLFLGHLFKNDILRLRVEKAHVFLKVLPYTMAGYKRLANAYDLAQDIENNGVKGSFVEFGVWKGGISGAMAKVADSRGSKRIVWLFDSFEGLPEPTDKDGGVAQEYAEDKATGKFESIKRCVGPLEDVQHLLFSVLRLQKENIKVEKGWFQETLPLVKTELGPIAILRLDADWYESTKYLLEELYDQVVSGGYIIIDDYGHWEGCKKAVDEFMEKRNIKTELIRIDYTGVYFQKK